MKEIFDINKIILILQLCLCSLAISAQSVELINLIKGETQDLPNGTELSIGVLENGKWVKVEYRLENDEFVEVKNDDKIFEIGSITKTFTASLIMKLLKEGKLALSDPIQKYLPIQMAQDSFEEKTITVQHLITHTSGLSSGPSSFTLPYLRALLFTPKNPNRNFKVKHYYRYLKKFELDYLPGKEWNYNNAGYGLLGEIISNVNGMSWEKSVQKNIFIPLGMRNSYFEIDKHNRDQLVVGITAKGKKSKPWEMKFINPAGAIKSTLNDMIIYASAQLNSSQENLNFFKLTQDPLNFSIKMPEDKLWKGNKMGLGWWHNLEDTQNTFMWHGGSSGGYTSFVGFSKLKGKAVVILSNISSSNPSARAENRIPKPILLGQKILRM
ncbi:MAG: beta-lactamase family protein [Saprospiraceae bacterium]|nr:beta-lactamase family protein [Saprospiraceae bacterium]MCB9326790.1 beta-lactamase family protein [Lewinellaceae bacterium]